MPENEIVDDPATEETAPEPKAKTYTKAELDGQISKAVAKVRKEFGDVLELKTKAEQYDALQESSKSELQRLQERADRTARERDAALSRANSTHIRAAVISAASRLGSVDPEIVAAALANADLSVEGDDVPGAEEAVRALLARKPFLRAGAARGGVEINGPGQQPGAPIARSQIRAWMKNGEMTPDREKQVLEAQKAGKILTDR
jgi:hypothetical protein